MSGTNSSALRLSASCAILYNVNSLILTTSWLREMNPPVWQTQSGFILSLLCWHLLLYLSFLLCRICASPADSSTRYQNSTSSHYITSHMQKENFIFLHIIKALFQWATVPWSSAHFPVYLSLNLLFGRARQHARLSRWVWKMGVCWSVQMVQLSPYDEHTIICIFLN